MADTMRRSPATILIVDDNRDSRELLVKLLTIKGYKTIEAVDGDDALKKATSKRPDLILMDKSLPKMSGYEVTKKLRQIPALQALPIVALTAHAMRGEKEKALKAGCDGYIAKPINVRTLPGVIADYLDGRQKEIFREEEK
jgi:two-component system cell cycle response regulator DivK